MARYILLFLTISLLSFGKSFSQTAMTGCTGIPTTLTQCGGTFADPGGTGNYADNSNCTLTVCPATAGQCVTLQFTAVNLENNFDYLRIYNGSTTGGTLLATITGTTFTGNVTSTTGCLTLVFTSDGSVTSTGWLANVICHPCNTPPPPPPGPIVASDCSGSVNICTNSSFQIDPSGSGAVTEFTSGTVSNPSTNPGSTNSGCLLSGELNSTWMVVNIASTGTLEFSIGANGGTGCLDWIMWPYTGPASCNQIINNTLAPIRCNWNGLCEGFTGMGTPLPAGGDATSFEPELNVTCGQKFLICLSNYSSQSTSLPLNFFGTATISCSTFTPITVNSATICPGASATLTATGGNTYTWSPSTGLSATTGASVTASPATTTTYTVTGTGSCGTGTATSTVTVLAANDPLCVTTCTATATNTGPYCVGGTVQLNGTGGGTYSWSGPNGFTSTLQNPTLPATAAAAGVYTLTITISGCTATATTTVVVNPVATANANVDQSVCAGGTVTLAGSFGGGATSGTWTAPTGSFSNATSMTSTYTPTATSGTVTLTLTTNDPTGPCLAVTDIMIVTINPLPTVTANSPTVCAGGSVTLTGGGASTYTWTGGVANGVAFVPAATGTYTVTGTTAAGCTNTAISTVTVNPLPTVVANNVSVCATGTTAVTASGASTYTWSPATYLSATTGSSVTFTPGVTTTYTVSGTSVAGCVSTDPVTVTVLANAPINAGADVTICAGSSTTITATGGTTYNWTGLGTNASYTVTPASTTTYNVSGTDANGCVGADAVVVTVNPNPTVTVNSPTVCAGATATVTATPTPAGTYNYAWTVPAGATNPGNVATFSATVAGTYSVIITNATTNCSSTSASGTVTINPNPTVTVNSPTVCAGATATVTASPTPAGTYNYAWTVPGGAPAPGNVASFTATVSGTYSVIITNPTTGCFSPSASGTVTVNPNPTVTVNSPTVCAGTAAIVTATPVPAGTYNYAWTVPGGAPAPGNVATFTATVNGTYSVIITNPTTTCVSTSASGTVTINPNPTVTVNSPTVCAGTPASVTATPGVAGTYNYAWTVPAGATNPGNASNFTATVNGTYSVVITNPTTGCFSTSASGVVTINPIPVITLTPTDPTVCNGTDGSIAVSGTGTGNVTWTGTTTGSNNGVTLPNTITGLGSGSYNVTFTNTVTGCVSATVSTTLNNPGAPVINALPNLVTCGTAITINESSITGTNLTSNIGFFSAPNGVGPIADGTTYNSPTPTTTVYVYDVNGVCTAQISFTVTVNPIPTVTVNSPTVCAGTPATVTATPGTAATYSYAWTVPAGATNPGNVATFTTTTAGTYSVIITNTVTSCVSTSASGVVTINPNPTVTVNSPAVCAGTPATVTATPGTAATYSYAWTVPAGAAAPGNVATFNTTTAGTYSVIITNTTTTCVSTSASGTVTINPNPTATVNSPTVCSGVPATVTAAPGVAGTYSYAWTVPAGATAPGNVASFTTTTAGTYSVVLTNTVTGCVSASASGTVTVNANPTVTVNSPTVCVGTPASVTATPAPAGTYSYAWTVPAGATAPGNVANFNTSIAGTYSVIITNTTTTCVSTSAAGTVTINPNPTVTVNSSTVCAGTPASVTATPGTAGTYDYVWTVPVGAAAPGNVATFNTTTAGTYSVIITNPATTCFSTSASGTVIVNPLPTATIAGTITLCQNQPQPTVTFTGANGTAPYTFTYTLNGGANQTITSTGNTATISAPTSTAGTFTYTLVSVQDASSTACSQAQAGTAVITINPLPTATITGTANVCEGGASQTVTLTGANGTAPYTFTYNINNGPAQTITSTGNIATITVPATTPGIFNYNLVSVQDASATGCSQAQTGTATITINALPVVFAGNDVSVCEDQTVTLTGSGANIYTWDNSITNGVAFNPAVGTTTYTVTGTTTAGCVDSDQVDVTVNPLPTVSFLPDVTLGCAPLTVNFTNTTANATNCVWTMSDGTVLTGCGTVSNTFEQPGCYDISLTTTDANGCSSSFSAIDLVCVEGAPNASFNPSANVISELNPVVDFQNTTTGASDYVWNFGDSSPTTDAVNPSHDYSENAIGNYLVTLIAYSPLGCSDTTQSVIQIYEELIYYVPNTFTPDDDNFNQTFQPIFTSGFDPYDYTLLIFNRWGEIIFESHDAKVGWNGSYGNGGEIEMVQDGVYTWKIEFKVTRNDERKVAIGHVNILR